jgi:hypothetical protein
VLAGARTADRLVELGATVAARNEDRAERFPQRIENVAHQQCEIVDRGLVRRVVNAAAGGGLAGRKLGDGEVFHPVFMRAKANRKKISTAKRPMSINTDEGGPIRLIEQFPE